MCRSDDGGLTWHDISFGLTHLDVRALAVADTSLFAGTVDGGVFQFVAGTSRWIPCSGGLTIPDVRALAPGGPGLFAGTWGRGVWRSGI